MTDGIIQEVIQEFINGEINIKKKGYDSIFESNEDMLIQLRKELIEKIKQRFPIDYDENYSMWHEAIQKILIGDNQE